MIALYRVKRHRREKEFAEDFNLFLSYAVQLNEDISEIDMEHRLRYRYITEHGKVTRTTSPSFDEGLVLEYLHPDDREAVREYCTPEGRRKLIQELGAKSFEVRMRMEDDSYRWKRFALQGLPRSAKRPMNYMMYKMDIHEMKCQEAEIQQNLKDALTVAEQVSKAKGIFMSRMSHEIRTPLNAIIWYMALAQGAEEEHEKVLDYVAKAGVAAQHLLGIINDVLDMSSIESGKMKHNQENFDLKQLISGLTAIFLAQSEQKGVSFKVTLEQVTEECLVGDALRLNQILMNLLSNAVKFTPEGGNVHLTVRQNTCDDRHASFFFIVRGDGIGMSEEYLRRIWTPFEQESAQIAAAYGGTGLGLSIVKNRLYTKHWGKKKRRSMTLQDLVD